MGNCAPRGGQIHNSFDDIAIVNYPCYYCNGFQAHKLEMKTGHDIQTSPNSVLTVFSDQRPTDALPG